MIECFKSYGGNSKNAKTFEKKVTQGGDLVVMIANVKEVFEELMKRVAAQIERYLCINKPSI
jgi:hypothetical protein